MGMGSQQGRGSLRVEVSVGMGSQEGANQGGV